MSQQQYRPVLRHGLDPDGARLALANKLIDQAVAAERSRIAALIRAKAEEWGETANNLGDFPLLDCRAAKQSLARKAEAARELADLVEAPGSDEDGNSANLKPSEAHVVAEEAPE